MSAFTDRVYAEFLARNGGSGRPPRLAPRSRVTVNEYAAWRRLTGRDGCSSGGLGVTPGKRSEAAPESSVPMPALEQAAGVACQGAPKSPGAP